MTALHRRLVIDDSQTIRKLVELSFRGMPFALEFASTGADGIAKVAQGAPDLILLDCVLPDMKAAEVCERLARDDRTAAARIILMSAKDRESLKGTFERFPQIVDFVGKPFTTDSVVSRVTAAVTGQPRRESAAWPAPAAAAAGASPLGPRDRDAAAKVLYARLARQLASVPDWLREAGAAPGSASVPAFLARKLLTPEVVSSLLEGLLPLYKQALRAEHGAPPLRAPEGDGPTALMGRSRAGLWLTCWQPSGRRGAPESSRCLMAASGSSPTGRAARSCSAPATIPAPTSSRMTSAAPSPPFRPTYERGPRPNSARAERRS